MNEAKAPYHTANEHGLRIDAANLNLSLGLQLVRDTAAQLHALTSDPVRGIYKEISDQARRSISILEQYVAIPGKHNEE